jgi:hypothetical protein
MAIDKHGFGYSSSGREETHEERMRHEERLEAWEYSFATDEEMSIMMAIGRGETKWIKNPSPGVWPVTDRERKLYSVNLLSGSIFQFETDMSEKELDHLLMKLEANDFV